MTRCATLRFEQFTQTDPMDREAGSVGVSAYVYGASNPVVFVDQSGEREMFAFAVSNVIAAAKPTAKTKKKAKPVPVCWPEANGGCDRYGWGGRAVLTLRNVNKPDWQSRYAAGLKKWNGAGVTFQWVTDDSAMIPVVFYPNGIPGASQDGTSAKMDYDSGELQVDRTFKSGSAASSAVRFAHELGHYFGFVHASGGFMGSPREGTEVDQAFKDHVKNRVAQ